MGKAIIYLADGTEECEALLCADLLRRAGAEVVLAAVGGRREIVSSHGVAIRADALAEEADIAGTDLLVLPGGWPGTKHLEDCPAVQEAVLWAVEQGITKGTTATTFSPNAPCTRGQAVTFLCRAVGTEGTGDTGFADVGANSFCAGSVKWAVENGVTKGITATTFSPNETCTRGQIVTFLYRAMGK